jgi:hypothetical protein
MGAQLEEQQATKTSTEQELSATLKYIASLHAECDWLVPVAALRSSACQVVVQILTQ